jgi:hypothetical protein
VVDENGEPVRGQEVLVQQTAETFANIRMAGDVTAVTAADGTFTASDLVPGPHVVRVVSRAAQKIEPHFSPDDLKTVDQDLETSYWPGGTSQPTASIPLSPGSSASVGTIRIRKAPLYRAHVSVPHMECEAGEKVNFTAVNSSEIGLFGARPIPCTTDFLVTNLRPGTYTFRLQKDEPAPAMWALASVGISGKNIEVVLTLQLEAQIAGRIVAADGATLPPLNTIKVSASGTTAAPPRCPRQVYPHESEVSGAPD